MKISVALCTYNGEKYIRQQLLSIINQTLSPDEIIVSDDNSNDSTWNIAEDILCNSGIKYQLVRNSNKAGVVGNFQNAIGMCTGDIIFTSDQDDVWSANKIEVVSEYFRNDSRIMLCFTDADLVDASLQPLKTSLWKSILYSPSKNKSGMFDLLLNKCVVTGATMAFRSCVYKKSIPFPSAWLHDGWLAINAAVMGEIKPIEKKLILYRQHGNNTVGTKNRILRLKLYISGFNKMGSYREKKYMRYTQFKELNNETLNEYQKTKLNQCINFWKESLEISGGGY